METLNYKFISKINKYSKISLEGLRFKKEYQYRIWIKLYFFDECFGISIDFTRKSYTEEELKPQDTLTIMFLKNIGSYKSTNLAVSENDKQDISWKVAQLKMNYLINLIFTILIFYSNSLIANDNEIIFEINNKIYSALDLNIELIT